MKVAVFGRTLYSGVLAGVLAEYGHQVYWCDVFLKMHQNMCMLRMKQSKTC